MNNEIVKLNVPNAPALSISGEYIILKPFCEQVGLDFEPQRKRLMRMVDEGSAVASMMEATGSDGKTYKMVGVHKDDFRLWLLGIDTNRMKNSEAAKLVLTYKREVKQVLKDYYEKGTAVSPRAYIDPTVEAQRLALIAAARDFGFIDPQHAQAQAEIQLAIGLGRAPAIEQVFIYCESYLLDRGCEKAFAKKFRSAFGAKVSKLYQDRYGMKPPKHQGEINGKVTSMYYYTPKDRDLLDSVFESYIEPKLETQ